ncbi:hypothetical protein SRB5_48740 [Streptomyces sp. RB5]|uniref:Phosphatidic acid phosphatase type 2/haloperoxidase domain-containing protein n=1 Tax=Streptomyces smaragdinus TaxID=2585196 RepID=A0A7K0CMJ1_9ACTN|nr:phosphatase PAP2 family protein [Streptomyces smaragdinus]MQY14698.1 hypothetical protein [Streptomyces smaragdinus]
MEAPHTDLADGPPSGAELDASVLRGLGSLVQAGPGWLDRLLVDAARFGIIVLLVALAAGCWVRVRHTERGARAAGAMGALLWAPVAAGIAFAVNAPIKGFVRRERPAAADVAGVDPLLPSGGWSFVSDHAAVAAALAVAVFIAHRGFGTVALGLALLEGVLRVGMEVHYPTDVVGGFALGAATALLLGPVAMGRLSWLVRRLGLVPDAEPDRTQPGPPAWAADARADDDLAA